MTQVQELTSRKTADEIKAEADENGSVDFQFPLTRGGWDRLAAFSSGDPVVLLSGDGATFIGTVDDTDEDHYAMTIDLR